MLKPDPVLRSPMFLKVTSFQEFKNNLLEPGLVDHIVVHDKSVAEVYARSSPRYQTSDDVVQGSITGTPARGNVGLDKYYFNIGSVESFGEKLEEAQEALGIDPHDYVPVTYDSGIVWNQELIRFSRLRDDGGSGGDDCGKAHVTEVDKNAKNKVCFKYVAGCDEAKQEIMEFMHFFKIYEELGAKMPKGALLVGPPGTGKTLLAKATAGEYNLSFLSRSGSDFMEGSCTMKTLFDEARQHAGSIKFMDEIDAIGRERGCTLKELLEEMDGSGTADNVIVLAATNRPDLLDKALLRYDRFRQITIDKPDIKGREQIFEIYLKKIKVDHEPSYYSRKLAAVTAGFTGEDIANFCNEAALTATWNGGTQITMEDFNAALDTIMKNKVRSEKYAGLLLTMSQVMLLLAGSWNMQNRC